MQAVRMDLKKPEPEATPEETADVAN
jgi:hypothetical protein